MVLMLQLEAAERYAANPGTKNFGAISIFLQSAFELMPGHRVAAACFHPRPDVDSCLLHLVRRPAPFHFARPVRTLIRECFQQRRKQLGAVLRKRLPDGGRSWLDHLATLGFSAQSRAEQIPVAAWQELTLANPSV
jgi:16S rRNA (adenine1518-N6/adenine1519-N6)-dimethyltransferase